MKVSFIKYVLTLLVIGSFISPTLALEDRGATAIEKSTLQLGAVKDDDKLTLGEKLNKEIEARAAILEEVFNLIFSEIDNLKNKLELLPEFTEKSREQALQNQFFATLEAHQNYYELRKQKLAALLEEEGNEKLNEDLKTLAKELKNYRDDLYSPEIQKVIEFTLLFSTEGALSTVRNRLNKITADVKKLEKLGLLDRGTFRLQLDKASRLVNSAAELQSQAKNLILSPKLDEATDGDKERLPPKIKSSPRELLEKSLSSIKAVYEIFLKMSKDTRKILKIDN